MIVLWYLLQNVLTWIPIKLGVNKEKNKKIEDKLYNKVLL